LCYLVSKLKRNWEMKDKKESGEGIGKRENALYEPI
jgi:hypothetical protein